MYIRALLYFVCVPENVKTTYFLKVKFISLKGMKP